ncbi:MAG: YjgP/YjgQ family permease [Candidatus Caenarcaniphilales bacterium]|nr:YjgP/YjgQ family permease [Candidatus Caenarcaniphilales bacterium]
MNLNLKSQIKLERIDLYVLGQFVLPFLSATGIVTGVWLGIDRFKEIAKIVSSESIPWYWGPYIMLLDIPKIILNTLPVCILLACFLAFQRLSAQAEFIAMRAAGASLLRILKPVLVFGLIGSLVCFIVSEFIYPFSEPKSKAIYARAMDKSEKEIKSFSYIKRNEEGETERIFYVKSSKPLENEYKDIVLVDFKESGPLDIYLASNASFDENKQDWDLRDLDYSFIERESMNADKSFKHNFKSDLTKFKISSKIDPRRLLSAYRDVSLLNFIELSTLINFHKSENLETSSLASIKSNFHKRFSYPGTCMILAIIGALLGLSAKRQSVNWNYILLGLIVFSFFMSQAIFNSFGDSGRMSAFMAMWMPNFFLMFIAYFIYQYKLES